MSDNPWIPVKEMLPESLRMVWVWTDYTFPDCMVQKYRAYPAITIHIGWMNAEGFWRIQTPSFVRVLYWMPMPPAPPGQTYPPLRYGVAPGERKKFLPGVTL